MHKAVATVGTMTVIGIPAALAMTLTQVVIPGLGGTLIALGILVATVIPAALICSRILTRNSPRG